MLEMINRIIQLFRQGIPCLFHLITGFYCPGCGGTRAAVHLLHGRILKSFSYHPLVPYIAFAVLLILASWIVSKLWKRPGWRLRRYDILTYIGVAIVVVNWVWKNYMLVAKGIEMLP